MTREQALQNYLAEPSFRNRNALVNEHLDLIRYVARRVYRLPDNMVADACQEGSIGLCKAISDYQPDKGGFSTYATLWIKAAIKKWMEGEIRQTRCSPIGAGSRRTVMDMQPVKNRRDFPSDEMFQAIADKTPGPVEHFQANNDHARLHSVLNRLPLNERERAILNEHIMGEQTLSDLAVKFGVSKQRIEQVKSKVVRQVAEAYGE